MFIQVIRFTAKSASRKCKERCCDAIFFDKQDNPIDSEIMLFDRITLPGLSKRVTGQKVSDKSIKENSTNYPNVGGKLVITETRVKFGILAFEIVE